jgi:hypothetical protein
MTKMKIIFSLIGLLYFISAVYSQSNNCKFIGFINGYDRTRCEFCGGWLIEVNDRIYRADSIPNAKVILGPDENTKFPIPIYVDYVNDKIWVDRRIVITCIKKR